MSAATHPRADAGAADIFLLTGFLGSGKTTLLNRLLRDPAMADTLVLINEFGEIGLDHHLIEAVRADMVVLASGCLCCTIRGDLSRTLLRLAAERARGEIPPYRRVVIETTGLADPVPILQLFLADAVMQAHYRLAGVITTVDAVHANAQLAEQPEAMRQLVLADRIVLTKTDLVPAAQARALRAALRRRNPTAPMLQPENADAAILLAPAPFEADAHGADVAAWLGAPGAEHHHHAHDVNRHGDRIRALCVEIDGPVSVAGIEQWAEQLVYEHGPKLLRLKGIVDISGAPFALHGVQQLLHPPVRLAAFPFPDRRSRIVLIVNDLDPAMLQSSLRAAASPG